MEKYLSDLQLKDDVPAEPKARALMAFLAMGESAVDFLLERIRSSGDRHEKYAATEVLGFLGHHSAFDPLLAILVDIVDIEDHWLLCHWSRTIGCLADRRAAETLVRLCRALTVIPFNPSSLYTMQSNAAAIESIKHDALGEALATALGVVGDDSAIPVLVPMLGDDCFGIRDAAAQALVELGATGIDVLLPVARDLKRPKELRRSPVRALGRSNDPRVVSVLIELLQYKEPHVRDKAISALRELVASAKGESDLAVALDSSDPQVRRDLAAGLAEGKDTRGFDLLTNDVSAGNNPYACAGAARALGKLGDNRAFDTLAPLLNSNEKELRQAGAEALGHLGDPRAIPALASALKDREKEVREAVALSLAYLKDARAFEPLLVALLPSGLAHHRLEAIDAFGSLGDVRAVEPLVRCLRWASGPERRAIYIALGRLGTPAIGRLLVELTDARPLVRSKAAAALGNIGAASAQEQLTKLLDDSDTQVKSAAAGALRKLTVESSSSPSNATRSSTPAKKSAQPTDEQSQQGDSTPTEAAMPSHGPSERDNAGTRYETQESVNNFWLPYVFSRPKFPFIFYCMREKKDAMDAMLSLPPIKIASDSGKLISTEVLQFGVYPIVADGEVGSWGFFLAGEQISLALYDAAIASCRKYHGTKPRVSDPPKGSPPVTSRPAKSTSASVSFEWEEKVDMLEQMKARGIEIVGGEPPSARIATKHHYKAPNKQAALAFLKATPVDKPFYYLVVHTPDGVFGRDKDGIFEQPD
jgi:HEAT repeat protein/nitrate reductase NapE component